MTEKLHRASINRQHFLVDTFIVGSALHMGFVACDKNTTTAVDFSVSLIVVMALI